MTTASIVQLILRGEDEGATALLDETTTATDGLIGSLGKLAAGGAAVATVAAVGAAVYELATFAGEAGQELNKLQIRTGATAEELDKFKGNVLAVRAAGLGDDFATAAEAVGTVETVLGAAGEELERITQKALVLDDAFDTGLNETVRTTDTLMEQFGGTADRNLDLITRGLQATGDPADDLLDSLNEYSGNFAQADFAATDFLNILNSGLEAGARNTDDLADAVREFTIRVVDGSDKTREGFALLGIDVDLVKDQLEGGAITIADVFDIVQTRLNDAEFATVANQAAIALYGTKADDAGLQVIQSLDRQIDSLGDFEGASQQAVDTFTSGFANSTAKADSLIERLKLLAGDTILPVAVEGLERLVGLGEVALDAEQAVAEIGDLRTASRDAAAELVNVALDLDAAAVAAGENRIAVQAANQALVILEDTYKVAGGTIQSAEESIIAINIANELLAGGFRGTGEELAALTVNLFENSEATAEAEALAASFADAESIAALKTADRADQSERLTSLLNAVAVEDAALAEETAKAAAAAEAAALAEADRARAVEESIIAVNTLNQELAAGFSQSLGALEAGQELDTLNESIYNSVAASGAGAVELATLAFALGDAGEQAIIEALKFEILQEGLSALAQAAAEDGQITTEEIQGIISGANDLQRELDRQFTVAFAAEGADGVIEAGDRLVGELETVTAAEYGVTLTSNLPEIEGEAGLLVTKLAEVDQAVEAVITADTGTAEDDIGRVGGELEGLGTPYQITLEDNTTTTSENIVTVGTDLDGLTAPIYQIALEDNTATTSQNIATVGGELGGLTAGVYNVDITDNAAEVQGDISNLSTALNGLNGTTYTFTVAADTSGVPDWAIPRSPLPIAVAWDDFINTVNSTPIRPSLAGEGSLLPPTLPNSGGGLGQLALAPAPAPNSGGRGGTLVIYGNVNINDRNDPAAAALVEFLNDQIQSNNNEGF